MAAQVCMQVAFLCALPALASSVLLELCSFQLLYFTILRILILFSIIKRTKQRKKRTNDEKKRTNDEKREKNITSKGFCGVGIECNKEVKI